MPASRVRAITASTNAQRRRAVTQNSALLTERKPRCRRSVSPPRPAARRPVPSPKLGTLAASGNGEAVRAFSTMRVDTDDMPFDRVVAGLELVEVDRQLPSVGADIRRAGRFILTSVVKYFERSKQFFYRRVVLDCYLRGRGVNRRSGRWTLALRKRVGRGCGHAGHDRAQNRSSTKYQWRVCLHPPNPRLIVQLPSRGIIES